MNKRRIRTSKWRLLTLAASLLASHGAVVAAGTDALLYTSNRGNGPEIYIDRGDGSAARRLTESKGGNEQPRWSPDGGKIAFVSYRDGDPEIYLMNADGSKPTRLTHSAGEDSSPRWSPDGKRLAFVSTRSGVAQVHVMNADGSGARQLASSKSEQGTPVWSPDGSRIAFIGLNGRKGEIQVAEVDGPGRVNLSATAKKGHSSPTWSPDGKRIAAVRHDGDTVAEIVVLATDGSGGEAELSPTRSFLNTQPIWSPDGRRIAFLSTRDHPEGTRANVFVMNPDGSKVVNVAGHPDTEDLMVNWSADGSRLLFVAMPWGSSQIHTVRPDGSDRRQISAVKAFDLDPQHCCSGAALGAQAKNGH